MASGEKRSSSSPAEAGSGVVERQGRGAPAAEFLLRSGVTEMVRAALLQVLESRPEEPVAFLAGYFEKLAQSSPEAHEEQEAAAMAEGGGGGGEAPPWQLQLRLDRAAWYLSLAHHARRTAFSNNVSLAYDCLGAAGRRKKPGVNGKLYSELLRRLCRDRGLPEDIVQPLLKKLLCRDHEAVPFDVFRFGALTCLVLLEFMAKAGTLYNALGSSDSGGADKRVCVAILGALEEALQPSDVSVPIRYLEAGHKLGPDRLALAMDKSLAERKASLAMKKDEFLKKAASIFIAKVKPVN